MKALFLTLVLAFSCTKYSTVSRDAVGVHINPVKMPISHLNEIEWFVGKKKEEKISQSFTFMVDMPKIKEDDLAYLTEHKGVDAWIVRLIVYRGSEQQDLGSLYAEFRPRVVGRGAQSAGAATSVSMKVYYAAAYASERFRTFRCPAFGHTKKISDMSIRGSDEEFSLAIAGAVPYNEKSQRVELAPTAFNGGNSLKGEYYVEIAAYDSKNKTLHSTFKRIPMTVSIDSEEEIRIPSCDGVHSELQ